MNCFFLGVFEFQMLNAPLCPQTGGKIIDCSPLQHNILCWREVPDDILIIQNINLTTVSSLAVKEKNAVSQSGNSRSVFVFKLLYWVVSMIRRNPTLKFISAIGSSSIWGWLLAPICSRTGRQIRGWADNPTGRSEVWFTETLKHGLNHTDRCC